MLSTCDALQFEIESKAFSSSSVKCVDIFHYLDFQLLYLRNFDCPQLVFSSLSFYFSKKHQKICLRNERICFSWAYSSFVWLKTIEFSTWCDGNRQQICGLCCLTLDHLQRVGVEIATWSSVLNTFLLFLFIVYGSNGNKPHKTSIRTDQFMLSNERFSLKITGFSENPQSTFFLSALDARKPAFKEHHHPYHTHIVSHQDCRRTNSNEK